MKNKLISTLLAFTTLTSLAQQPNNAELLTCLKNIKPTIMAEEEYYSNLVSQFDQADYPFLYRILDDFSYNPSMLEFGSHVFEHVVDIIGTIEGFAKPTREIMATLEPLVEKSKEELFTQFESVYNKNHQNYCQNNPNGTFAQIKASDVFNYILQINIFVKIHSTKRAVPYPYVIIGGEIVKLENQA